jgi:hypothetical protein
LRVIGTPVTGLGVAPQVTAFVKKLPEGSGKRTILFCTYEFAKWHTLDALAKEFLQRGYHNILSLSKKGIRPDRNDFKKN